MKRNKFWATTTTTFNWNREWLYFSRRHDDEDDEELCLEVSWSHSESKMIAFPDDGLFFYKEKEEEADLRKLMTEERSFVNSSLEWRESEDQEKVLEYSYTLLYISWRRRESKDTLLNYKHTILRVLQVRIKSRLEKEEDADDDDQEDRFSGSKRITYQQMNSVMNETVKVNVK